MSDITISTAEVPSTFCWTSPQQSWPFLVGLLQAQLAGETATFNFGANEPDPQDRGNPWIRLNADGSMDKVYAFYNGLWISPHAIFTGAVMMYEGTEVSIVTLDGGEAGTVTSTSGPMWEKVSEMNGRLPIGPGTTPATTAISISTDYGTDEFSLAIARENLPAVPLNFGTEKSTVTETDDDLKPLGYIRTGNGEVGYEDETVPRNLVGKTNDMGDGEALEFNQLPPVRGIWFIRKTARRFYRV